MQGKHDLGMNMNAVVKSVNVPAWSKVSSSCSITLGGKVVAAGLASHQMLFCVLKSTIPGLCWSAETLSLSDIPHIIDAICQFLSPESRTHWEQSLWISIVPGLTCSRYPADCFQLCVLGPWVKSPKLSPKLFALGLLTFISESCQVTVKAEASD